MPDANPSPPEAGDGTPDPPAPRTGVWRRTVSRIGADNLTDAAAALTYYSVLSIFPGLLVVAAGLGLLGTSAPRRLLSDLTVVAPGPVREILTGAVTGLASSPGTAGVMAIAGLLGALWAASGYVGAFMRASNMVYGVSEDRPLWKALPIRLAITLAVGTL
ncbi:MAG: YihY/virulence factor BrkB family protein, partial [Stackebrandtia sp.]